MARRRRRSDTVVRGPSVGTAIHNHASRSWGIHLDKEAAKGGMGSERESVKRSLESLHFPPQQFTHATNKQCSHVLRLIVELFLVKRHALSWTLEARGHAVHVL
jgi:hypothetical protein